MFNENTAIGKLFEINVNELISFGSKYGLSFEENDIIIEGESIFFTFLSSTYDGEMTFEGRTDFFRELSKNEYVDFIKINDFRIEIYFKTENTIELI